jgi:N-acetylglucosaminyl-diphospho-decaprenol L-rhamnosyltransferase
MSTPRLSIVIVSFNTRVDLERCLGSISAAPPAVPYEIVVVDNASSDGSPGAVRAGWPAVTVIEQSSNAGFSAANNVGIRASRGETILLLNSDCVVPPGAIDVLLARLAAHPEAGAAGPKLVDGDGRVELSFGRMMSPLAELRQKWINWLYDARVGAIERWVSRETNREHDVDWVSGAALLAYRRDLDEADLLDERYFLYTEDVDLCAAIRARGRRILFTPEATITHLRGRSRATVPAAANAAYRRSHLAFYEKHHPRWAKLLRTYLRLKGELPPQGPSG